MFQLSHRVELVEGTLSLEVQASQACPADTGPTPTSKPRVVPAKPSKGPTATGAAEESERAAYPVKWYAFRRHRLSRHAGSVSAPGDFANRPAHSVLVVRAAGQPVVALQPFCAAAADKFIPGTSVGDRQ
jgi:hypothetical protein